MRDAPSDENSDAALERMTKEHFRPSAHIEWVLNTHDALGSLIVRPPAHHDARLTAVCGGEDCAEQNIGP